MTTFKGSWTALVTPFNYNDEIDYSSLDKLIKHQIDGKITGIILFGTTGEGPTISVDEKIQMLDYITSCYKDKIKIVVGVGGNNTKEVINFIHSIKMYEVTGLMVTVPNYNKPTQDGIAQHFITIASTTKLPIMVYNIPSRCGVNLEVSTLKIIVTSCTNIIGIKEASGNHVQVMDILHELPKLEVFAGDDFNTYHTLLLGGSGVVSVIGNILPKSVAMLVDSLQTNQIDDAKTLQFDLHDLTKLLFVQSNPIPIKYLLAQQQIITNDYVRLPLVKLNDKDLQYNLTTKFKHIKTRNIVTSIMINNTTDKQYA
jgi:4-hydroxy-tetrahydrodipicolinate synthase